MQLPWRQTGTHATDPVFSQCAESGQSTWWSLHGDSPYGVPPTQSSSRPQFIRGICFCLTNIMFSGAGLRFAHAVLSEPCHRGHAVTLLPSWERVTPLTQDVAQAEPGRWEPEGRLNLAVGGLLPGMGGSIPCWEESAGIH